jgi:hypothetical protein
VARSNPSIIAYSPANTYRLNELSAVADVYGPLLNGSDAFTGAVSVLYPRGSTTVFSEVITRDRKVFTEGPTLLLINRYLVRYGFARAELTGMAGSAQCCRNRAGGVDCSAVELV